jgi:hypothetical protein
LFEGYRPAMRRSAVVLVVLLAACAGSDGDGAETTPADELSAYETPAEMAEALGCEGFSADELADPRPGEGRGRCYVDDQQVILDVFADEAAMEADEDAGRSIGCSFADDLGYERLYFAAGDLWTVRADDNSDKSLTDRLAEDLGGETRTIDCT